MKKPFLVDVPVALNVFVRPGCLEQVFEAVRQARPSVLFLVSDGPRKNVPTDVERIKASRKVVENIDWDCRVFQVYEPENHGMYAMGRKKRHTVFEKFDRCVFLEDDVLPAGSHFRFCVELLEMYKDDERVQTVGGKNFLGVNDETSADYFFSKAGSSWGNATWKRTAERYDKALEIAKDRYIRNRLRENSAPVSYKNLEGYLKNPLWGGHPPGTEFFKQLCLELFHSLNIVPKKNMIRNIGYTAGSAHAPDSLRKMNRNLQANFHVPVYECSFPLKHPACVIEDRQYERMVNHMKGYGHPFLRLGRRLETLARTVVFNSPSDLGRKIVRKMKPREIET